MRPRGDSSQGPLRSADASPATGWWEATRLDAVLACARALHAGEPSAVLVSGRAGMGKSRLVFYARAIVEPSSWRMAAPPAGGPAADAGSVHYFCRVLAEPVPVG